MVPLLLILRKVNIFTTDIGRKFRMKKFVIFTMKRRKIVRCEVIMLPISEVIKEVEKEGYKYLGIVELDNIKENGMKEK